MQAHRSSFLAGSRDFYEFARTTKDCKSASGYESSYNYLAEEPLKPEHLWFEEEPGPVPRPTTSQPSQALWLEQLASGWYNEKCQELETKLNRTQTLLVSQDTTKAQEHLVEIRSVCRELSDQWEKIQSGAYLPSSLFFELQQLQSSLAPLILQTQLYELDLQRQLFGPNDNYFPIALALTSQGFGGVIGKDKTLEPFSFRLLTGSSAIRPQAGPLQVETVLSNRARKSKELAAVNDQQTYFKHDGSASIVSLKFNGGTFPNLVRLKFSINVGIVVCGQEITKTIESQLSHPYISITNTGAQWKDSIGAWLKEDCFQGANEVSTIKFCNYLNKHYLEATKQKGTIARPLYAVDLDYLLRAKFGVGVEKQAISQKEFNKLWDWFGPALKKIRFHPHMLWLFLGGFIPAFVTNAEATRYLSGLAPGTFLVRLSERLDGEFVISYAHSTGVRHYLVQPDDTGEKKNFVDLLGATNFLQQLIQVTVVDGQKHWVAHSKDAVLSKFYKKPPTFKPKSGGTHNPYDNKLP